MHRTGCYSDEAKQVISSHSTDYCGKGIRGSLAKLEQFDGSEIIIWFDEEWNIHQQLRLYNYFFAFL